MNFDDASKALVELAASRHNAFHTSEAAEIQFTNQRLRRAEARGELYFLQPKVWAVSALPRSNAQRLRAATLSIQGSAASLRSAAWLHGWIDAPPTVPQVWHTGGVGRRRTGLVAHRRSRVSPNQDVTDTLGIRSLNKAATLCLLGIEAHPLVVEKCLDEFLRTESETWLRTTMERLYHNQCRGSRCLASILNDPRRIDGVTDSWLERVVAKLVSFSWMPPVTLQHSAIVEGRNFRLDIACPDLMLGVEAHGRQFHWGPGKADADNTRDLLFVAAGWQLIYVTHSQIVNPEEFVRLFAKAARSRARQLQIPLAA